MTRRQFGAATRPDPSGTRNGLPERKPYVYRGETEDPPAVRAARERWRARDARIEATCAALETVVTLRREEAMPDIGPGPEWYRERAAEDGDEMAELEAARDRYQGVMALAVPRRPEPEPAPPPVTEAARCGRCGYLMTARGHKETCGE